MAPDKSDKNSNKARELQGDNRKPRSKRTDKKPTPDMEVIRALNESLTADPKAAFIFALYWRARALLDESGLPPAAIAFEVMQSALSALEGGLAHSDIADGYPVTAWRQDTVEIPRAWLRVLVQGWEKYKSGSTGSTFGEAFDFEGAGQGKQPVRTRLQNLNKSIRLSNKAMVEYLGERADGGTGSLERACVAAADGQGVSEETAARAWKKHSKATQATLDYLRLLKTEGGKTS